MRPASPKPIRGKLEGSGIADDTGAIVASGEKLVKVVVPSKFTSIVKAKPSVVSLVSTGIVPAWSENMLKAKALPEVDIPSGAFRAGPNRLA